MDGSNDATKFKEILATVGKVSPLVGDVLRSNLSSVAMGFLSTSFSVDHKNIGALRDAIHNDPESAIKIKTIEYEHADTLASIANQSQSNTGAVSCVYKDFLRHMAYFVTAGFFAALLLLFLPFPFNDHEKELLSMLVGMLVSKWQTIIDFFYGSSHRQGG